MTATSTDRRAFEYRPHLDGLRTLAVYLVVIFHAGADRFSGGFIGVDLFFVLSGYLVTHVLISDLWSSGSVSLPRFYSRRVRRLLPAAVVALVATAAVFTLVASPVEARASLASFQAAFLYYANWHFISASTDYFAGDLNTNPVLHYWSLSIEEQFYVGWPIVLIGLTALRRRAKQGDAIVRGIVALVVLASALWALKLSGGNVNRAYYGTDTRAYQLLAGALLAMSPTLVGARSGRRSHRAAAWVGAAAVAVIMILGSSLLDMGPIARGIFTTAAAITALAALERSRPESPVRRALSTEPATYLGKISYGTYLWHWPVIIVLGRVLSISPIVTAVIAAIVATGLASLSSQLLEMPIRRSAPLQRVPKVVAIGGVTLSILVGLLVVPPILERDARSAGGVAAAGTTGRSTSGGDATAIDWQAASQDRAEDARCTDKPVERCRVVDGSGPRVVLLGDSHAIMLRPALEEIARRRHYSLYLPAIFGCSWHIGLVWAGSPPSEQQACIAAQKDWYERVLPAIKPDLVIVVQRAVDDSARPITMAGDSSTPPDLNQAQLLEQTADRALAALAELDVPVAIIESIPVAGAGQDPLECLSTAQLVDECRYVASQGKTPLETFYESRAGKQRVSVVNIDRAVCPYFPICDPVIDDVVVKWDATHLTTAYTRLISGQIEAALDDAGALP